MVVGKATVFFLSFPHFVYEGNRATMMTLRDFARKLRDRDFAPKIFDADLRFHWRVHGPSFTRENLQILIVSFIYLRGAFNPLDRFNSFHLKLGYYSGSRYCQIYVNDLVSEENMSYLLAFLKHIEIFLICQSVYSLWLFTGHPNYTIGQCSIPNRVLWSFCEIPWKWGKVGKVNLKIPEKWGRKKIVRCALIFSEYGARKVQFMSFIASNNDCLKTIFEKLNGTCPKSSSEWRQKKSVVQSFNFEVQFQREIKRL